MAQDLAAGCFFTKKKKITSISQKVQILILKIIE